MGMAAVRRGFRWVSMSGLFDWRVNIDKYDSSREDWIVQLVGADWHILYAVLVRFFYRLEF